MSSSHASLSLRTCVCRGLALLVIALAHAASAAPRNVVLFVADDMSQDAGCYGNAQVKTPALDALAREGVLFRNAFCTTASCSASRSVMLTGLHNHATGHYGHSHAEHHFTTYRAVRSLPNILGAHGYRTGRIGKYHLAPAETYHFETALAGNAWDPVGMAEAAKPFIADQSRPFFLYFCTLTPHRSGGTLEHPLKPNPFGNHQQYPGTRDVTYDEQALRVPPHLPDLPETRAELAQYYQAISRTDAGLARLVALLKETGQYENTLILFIADNGMAWPGAKTTMYEPGIRLPLVARLPHQPRPGRSTDTLASWVDLTPTILDFAGITEVLAPPFRAGDPEGVPASPARPAAPGKRAGDVPYRFHGQSLLPVFRGENVTRDAIFASHQFHEITMYYPMRMIRTARYKLILNVAWQLPYPFASDLHAAPTWQAFRKSGAAQYGRRQVAAYLQRPRFELYDLQEDPHEVRNLADSPAHQATFTGLAARLKDFQRETKDPWLSKYTYD